MRALDEKEKLVGQLQLSLSKSNAELEHLRGSVSTAAAKSETSAAELRRETETLTKSNAQLVTRLEQVFLPTP